MIRVAVPKDPNEVAAALRGMRAIRGYTRLTVALGTGIPTWKLAEFETGSKMPQPSEFARLWLFLSTGPAPEPAPEAAR